MYQVGKFYAIQAQDGAGKWFFVENLNTLNEHRERLKSIAKRAGRVAAPYNPMRDFDEYVNSEESSVKASLNPYELKLFNEETDVKLITSHMRHIRKACGSAGLNPNSLRIVTVESTTTVFVPEDQSEDQIELRKFALEKLSEAEKELLKVTHWEVYHKLGDRSMLDLDDDA